MKTDSVELHTRLDLTRCAQLINDSFRRMKADSVAPVQASGNPLDSIGMVQPDVAVVGSRAGKLNLWAIQVYIYALTDGCLIDLVAVGDGGFTRAMGGARNTFSLSKGRQQVQAMVSELRAADPSLTLAGSDPQPTPSGPSSPPATALPEPEPNTDRALPVVAATPTSGVADLPTPHQQPTTGLSSGQIRDLSAAETVVAQGANRPLPTSADNRIVLRTTWLTPPDSGIDVSALAVDSQQRAVSESHFVFYGNPRSPEGALAVKVAGAGDASVEVSLDRVPLSVAKILIIASIDPVRRPITFSDVGHLITTVHCTDDGRPLLGFDAAEAATQETAMLLCEVYRRDSEWKFRAIGQGFFDGLAGVIRTFGLQTA
ncbi:TerD family protein [Calidifontibacter indicus]|uniref:Stress response protein SCP2 n=1 Tax=Calidifontibacter indicus TaxID=419650 RepID=A0A3D9UJ21_9MICO|nr:TerD family protein [Calidifontibacter indicus]REF29297.1 stress response protein SCP2 [Calidifontibacter indicus]